MEEWEIQERRRKVAIRIVGVLIGTTILFLLLLFVARHSGGKSQDRFSLICQQKLEESRGRSGK